MTAVETPQGVCRFGIARCDITPPVGIYHRTWGAASHDRATGIHRPLTATAMCFRNGPASDDTEQIVVAVDHCLLWARELANVLEQVGRRTGVPKERISLAFSHTHSAGLMG